MPTDRLPPDFDAFTRWLAAREPIAPPTLEPSETLFAAAKLARDEVKRLQRSVPDRADAIESATGALEVLELLAAASTDTGAPPPEMLTPRGFRVTLAFDAGQGSERASICVLVHCPPELIEQTQGRWAYLWSGSQRIELGQFDADGKAIGILPAEIEISLDDFANGSVRLETPGSPDQR